MNAQNPRFNSEFKSEHCGHSDLLDLAAFPRAPSAGKHENPSGTPYPPWNLAIMTSESDYPPMKTPSYVLCSFPAPVLPYVLDPVARNAAVCNEWLTACTQLHPGIVHKDVQLGQ